MKFLILLMSGFLFIGCMSDKKNSRTEDYFKKNISIAKEVNKKCLEKGVIENKYERIECTNASNALMKNIKKPSRNDNNYKMEY